jgi:hypothetical protein
VVDGTDGEEGGGGDDERIKGADFSSWHSEWRWESQQHDGDGGSGGGGEAATGRSRDRLFNSVILVQVLIFR